MIPRLTPRTRLVLTSLGLSLLSACKSGGQAPPGQTPAASGPPTRVFGLGRPQPLPLARPVRAVWVARYHYRTADDIGTIMNNAAAVGCNTVYWQVRGEGTVDYPSRLEPWGKEFNFQSPGYDPLATAVNEAHRRGLRLEAWVNVMPGWRGASPPPIRGQLYNAHPDWFLYDAGGVRQPLGDFYVIVNPCLPEVRRHIDSVIDEIVAQYDVDGVHLDYVRYAWDKAPNGKKIYPRDPRTLALFQRDTGATPDSDPDAWHAWRANQLTRLVGEIRATVQRRRPGASLTAAVWNNPSNAYWDYLQNATGWLRSGLVDALVPMTYHADLDAFERNIAAYRALVGERLIVPGLGVYLHRTPEQLAGQLAECRNWGGSFALFSYESLFATAGDRPAFARTGSLPAETQRLRQMRRDVVAEYGR